MKTTRLIGLVGLAGLCAGAASAAGLSGAFGAVSRGECRPCVDGGLCTLDEDFESSAVLPAAPGPSSPVMGGACAAAAGVTNSLVGTAHSGVTADPIGGNATKKLKIELASIVGGGANMRLEWTRTGGAGRFRFRAESGQTIRSVQDMFVTTLATTWTSEPAMVSAGFILTRTLWGGQNSTPNIGLPIGPVVDFHTLAPDPQNPVNGLFNQATFPAGHPSAGAPAFVPVGQWFTIVHEFNSAGEQALLIDYRDGLGEIEVFRGQSIVASFGLTPVLDRLRWSGGSGGPIGSALFVDNLHVEGAGVRCAGDANFDGAVSFADLNIILSEFGQSGVLAGDVNGDGQVNFGDLNIVLSAFGLPCTV